MSEYLEKKEEVRTIARNVLWMANKRTDKSLYVRVRNNGELFYVAHNRMAEMKSAIKEKTRNWYGVFVWHNKLYDKNPIWVRIHQSTNMFYGGDAFSTPWQQVCCDTDIEPVYSRDVPVDGVQLTYNEFMDLLKDL